MTSQTVKLLVTNIRNNVCRLARWHNPDNELRYQVAFDNLLDDPDYDRPLQLRYVVSLVRGLVEYAGMWEETDRESVKRSYELLKIVRVSGDGVFSLDF